MDGGVNMKKASVLFTLVFLIIYIQPPQFWVHESDNNEDELNVGNSYLSSKPFTFSQNSPLPHPVDSMLSSEVFLCEKNKSFITTYFMLYLAMDIFPDAFGFIKIVISQSNYLS